LLKLTVKADINNNYDGQIKTLSHISIVISQNFDCLSHYDKKSLC